MFKKYLYGLLVFLSVCSLNACDKETSNKATPTKEKIVVAKLEHPIQQLFYSSVLEPISMEPLLSPAAGRIKTMNFSYGHFIKKGDDVLSIDSKSLTKDYQTQITSFLQKKTTYYNGITKFNSTKALYKAGLISKETYTTDLTSYLTKRLDFFQARFTLQKTLHRVGVSPKKIEDLTLKRSKDIDEILKKQFRHLAVIAPTDGIALSPISTTGDSAKKRLQLGTEVKRGELLLSIGNLDGLVTKIHVNEIDIDNIKKGMVAIVDGIAFPKFKLKGYVDSVSAQAKKTSGGNGPLSQFSVTIKVPKLTKAQKKKIRVGMTAKVTLNIAKKSRIMIPIQAVFQKNGQRVVTIIQPTGQRKSVPVTTGYTTINKVSITKGIKPGDKIVVPNNQPQP